MRISSIFLTLSFVLIGCNTSSPLIYTGGGTECDPTKTPILSDPSQVVGSGSQYGVTYAPVQPSTLPAGWYTYRGIQAYNHDPVTDVYVETYETVDVNNNLQQQLACVYNFPALKNAAAFSMIMPTVRNFAIDNNNNVTGYQKTYGFSWDGQMLHPADGNNVVLAQAAQNGASPLANLVNQVYNPMGVLPVMYSLNYPIGAVINDQTQISYQIRASSVDDKPPFQQKEILVSLVYTRGPPSSGLVPVDPLPLPTTATTPSVNPVPGPSLAPAPKPN